MTREKITVRCAGCSKTQTLRKRKVQVCDAYYCGRCSFKPAIVPEGFVQVIITGAAGGFWGCRLERGTSADLARILRAKQNVAAAIAREEKRNLQ